MGAALWLAYAPIVVCQAASVGDKETAAPATIEEISVYGKSPGKLRHEVYKAEDEFYKLFNTLNSDDEYDVHCVFETPTGSHVKRRYCRANYFTKVRSEGAQAHLRGEGANADKTHDVEVQKKNKLFQEELQTLMKEYPELLEALNKLVEATQALEIKKNDGK